MEKIKITCGCGEEGEVEVVNEVNVTSFPKLKGAIMEEKLNSFTCKGCGKRIQAMPKLLTYHDMEKRIVIYAYGESFRGRKDELKEDLEKEKEGLRVDVKRAMEMLDIKIKTKVVFGMKELREEIEKMDKE